MLASRRSRLSALIASFAVVAATLVPVFPAAAEDAPTPEPTPVVESVETPTPEPTEPPVVEPVETPTPEPTPEPTETTAPEPTESPEPEPTPEPEPDPDPDTTVQYAGTFLALSDTDDTGLRLFQVNGFGFLAVDVSGFAPDQLVGTRVATFELPEGLVLSGDETAQFTKLANAAVKKPLTLLATRVGLSLGKPTASLVNQTPATAATHRIYAVLVSPSNRPQGSTQNAAAVGQAVTYLDDYWNQQSSGTVRFTLTGTTSFYKSSYSCTTNSGSTALWNQAAGIAKTQLGYVAGKNNHLVLFFPSDQNCGSAIGLGTIGDTVNSGGVSWVIGTNSNNEKTTLAHEIGHNLSLGHADWMECSTASPSPGFLGTAGCAKHEYGDAVDVMGYGRDGYTAGALSSASAIRSGIWPASAWQTAPVGTTSYTLNTVASNTGLRSVVVQDSDGVNYFIEFRAFDGEDALGNGYGCYTSSCAAAAPGVRVLRLENNAQYFNPAFTTTGFLGFPGDETYLMGRVVSSVKRVNYTNGEIWWSQGSGIGIRMTVTAMTSSTATVQIMKNGNDATPDSTFYVYATDSYDSKPRVGDTWTAMAGARHDAQTTTFQWYRGNTSNTATTPIPGATSQNYTLQYADLGKYIRATMTGSSTVPTNTSTFSSDPSGAFGYGPIVTGVYLVDQPGSVAITNAGTNLTAVDSGWPGDHGPFTYQWYSGATATTATTAIGAATASTYAPPPTLAGKFIRVKITTTIPGYAAVSRYSPAKDYSIKNTVAPALGSAVKVGTQLTATVDTSYTTVDGSLSGVTTTYQWLRNGVAITGNADATDDADYTLTGADYLAKISLRVTAAKIGWVSNVRTSGQITVSQKGTITATSPVAALTSEVEVGAPLGMLISVGQTGVTEIDTTTTTKWYRVNRTTGVATLIPNATLTAYRPVASDYAYNFRAVLTIKKANYNDLPLTTLDRDFSIRLDPSTPLGFGGTIVQVGANVQGNNPTWKIETAPGSFTSLTLASSNFVGSYQWRAAGVSLGAAGANWNYAPIDPATVGKVLSYTVKATYPAYMPYNGTSPNTVPVAPAQFTNNNLPTVSDDPGPNDKTKRVSYFLDDVGPIATSAKIQWYRNGVAIPGATNAAYTITTADYGTTTSVKVSYIRLGYETRTLDANFAHSGPHTGKYWLKPDVAQPVIVGDLKTGTTLSVAARSYQDQTNGDNLPSGQVGEIVQWYRSGALVATAPTYTLGTADKGKSITAKVTATATLRPEILPSVSSSVPTQAIGTQVILGGNDVPVPSVYLDGSSTTFAAVLGVPDLATMQVTEPGVSVVYQWFRGPATGAGTLIPGATKQLYTLTTADQDKFVWARVTITKKATTTSSWTPVVKETTRNNLSIRTTATGLGINVPTTFTTGAEIAPVVPPFVDAIGATVNGTSSLHQWYRTTIVNKKAKTVAIPGATNPYYYLQAADVGATITVRVTVGKAGYNPYVVTYGTLPPTLKSGLGTLLNTATAPTVAASPSTGILLATPPAVTGQVLFPTSATQNATFTYQWLRNNAAIPKATKSTYTLTSADAGKDINVRVTAVLAGYTSKVLPVSTPRNYSIKPEVATPPRMTGGAWRVGTPVQVVDLVFTDAYGSALIPDTIKYEWLRTIGGKTTVVATGLSPNYTLLAADYNAKITARLTVTRVGFLPLVYTTPALGQLVLKGLDGGMATAVVQEGPALGVLTAAVNDLAPETPAPVYTYKWYRNDTLIPGATAKTYTLVEADRDKNIKVQITMTRANFEPLVTPVLTSVNAKHTVYADAQEPQIATDGTPQVGEQLTATPPDFYGNVAHTDFLSGLTYAYAWYRSGTVIAGQTGPTYVLQALDKDKTITVRVTAKHPGKLPGTSAMSSPTAMVTAGAFAGTFAAPQIGGVFSTKKVTAILTIGSLTTPQPYTLSYVWKRDGVVVAGQTASSFTLLSSDAGKDITVTITAKKPGFVDQQLGVARANTFTQGEPAVIVGSPVSVSAGTELDGAPPFYYTVWGTQVPEATLVAKQWLRNGTPIAGATGYTYDTTGEALGAVISFRVTVTSPYHDELVETTAGVTIT